MTRPHILLRSSWQSVNIGDIGHTPGLLALLEEFCPHARVSLWPCDVGNGVRAMLERAFPHVAIVEGELKNGVPTTPELARLWREATFFLHGSGPSLVRQSDLQAWAKTGKNYGVWGVTIEKNGPMGSLDDAQIELLGGARFVFTRETTSLQTLRDAGVQTPILEFSPDAAFGFHLSDARQGEAFLRETGLWERRFVAAIPRLRYTPYYKIHGRAPHAEDLRREAVSEQFVAADHQKLARALEIAVRNRGVRVLACPEMTYQVPLARSLLIEPQPADVRAAFVWRDRYWRPDEAGAVYAHAEAVVSFEMHSPILALAVGVPAIYLRQPTDTCKGQMWRDIGLGDWIFEIDQTDENAIAARLGEILADPAAARAKVQTALSFVRSCHQMAAFLLNAALV